MKYIVAIVLGVVLGTTSLRAQEKPIRIGIKIGIPQIVGLNAEYLTPAAGGRLAPNVDFSTFTFGLEETEFSFYYLEFGSNLYFKDTGKGAYANLSYGRVGFKGTYDDPVLGKGEGKTGFNLVNLKLGAKLGNAFYFRPELGYALSIGGGNISVEYQDPVSGNRVTEEENAPGLFGGLIGNFGFGFAF